MSMELVSKEKCFDGYQMLYKHFSTETQCIMKFSVYEPIALESRADVIYFLPGLTSSPEIFMQHYGYQQRASELGLIVVAPDTSPRGLNLPGENVSMFIGEAAGAYLDATEGEWARNYRMYSYVTKELPALINANFWTSGRNGIMGHSMGGHGALMIGLRNPDIFQSISATAPITNPSISHWATEQAWIHYLGDNLEEWRKYDSCEVAKNYKGPPRNILIDQGTEDELIDFLKPENFRNAVQENTDKLSLELRYHEGFCHSGSRLLSKTFGDHFEHHLRNFKDLP